MFVEYQFYVLTNCATNSRGNMYLAIFNFRSRRLLVTFSIKRLLKNYCRYSRVLSFSSGSIIQGRALGRSDSCVDTKSSASNISLLKGWIPIPKKLLLILDGGIDHKYTLPLHSATLYMKNAFSELENIHASKKVWYYFLNKAKNSDIKAVIYG